MFLRMEEKPVGSHFVSKESLIETSAYDVDLLGLACLKELQSVNKKKRKMLIPMLSLLISHCPCYLRPSGATSPLM